MQYRALFFDIDDTFFDYTRCSETALRNTCAFFGVSFCESLLKYYRKVDDALWKKQKQGLLSVEHVLSQRGKAMEEAMGISEQTEEFSSVFSKELGQTAELVENVLPVLAYTSQRYSLYCASNGIQRMQAERLKKASILPFFKDVYVSDELKYEKPDARFFDACLEKSGYTAEEVLMIGDSHSADVQCALHAGWNACWLNRHAGSNPYECHEITDLKELLTWL